MDGKLQSNQIMFFICEFFTVQCNPKQTNAKNRLTKIAQFKAQTLYKNLHFIVCELVNVTIPF